MPQSIDQSKSSARGDVPRIDQYMTENMSIEKKKNATPLGVTLSQLSATDIAALSIASGVNPGELFDSISKYFASI